MKEQVPRVFCRTQQGEQQDRNKIIKDKTEEGKKKGMNVEEAQWARKSPINLNIKSHLISSSHASHSRQSVKKSKHNLA